MFLDIKGAYDSVNRELLWRMLRLQGLDYELMQFLSAIYKDNRVLRTWEGHKCGEQVNAHRELKQRCPLSPILLMLYMAGLGKKLEVSKVGFNLMHMLQGEVVQQRIPGMLYADDIVLLADNKIDMQRLINSGGHEATDLRLNFSAGKSGITALTQCLSSMANYAE